MIFTVAVIKLIKIHGKFCRLELQTKNKYICVLRGVYHTSFFHLLACVIFFMPFLIVAGYQSLSGILGRLENFGKSFCFLLLLIVKSFNLLAISWAAIWQFPSTNKLVSFTSTTRVLQDVMCPQDRNFAKEFWLCLRSRNFRKLAILFHVAWIAFLTLW